MNALSIASPLREFGFLPGRLYNLAETLLGESPATARPWMPPVNVSEDDHAYRISVELPDVTGSDAKVVVRDGILTVKGERKAEIRTEGTKFHLVERTSGSFQRSFSLPKDANGEKVSAEFKNGVLLVSIPKRDEVKPREIEVTVK